MATYRSLDELAGAVGHDLGEGPAVTVTQDRIDAFADVTGDRQWIHVDPERAEHGPFGTTVAHGYLTLSLLPATLDGLLAVPDASMIVNYGLNRVRFLAPVRSGATIQARARVAATERKSAESIEIVLEVTVSADYLERPVCVAEMVLRYYFSTMS